MPIRDAGLPTDLRPLDIRSDPDPIRGRVAQAFRRLRGWCLSGKPHLVSGQVKASFASASIVGDCIVFNIGGNKYRLISRIRYTTQKVFVLKVMTHGEYDEDKWKGECGCFEPPSPPKKTKTAPAKRPTRRRRP